LLSREVRKFGCAFLSSQIGPEGSAPLPPWDLENTSHADLLPRSTHLRPRCAFGFPITRDHPITGSSDLVRPPARPFSRFCCKQRLCSNRLKGWPLRHAWGGPWATQGHPSPIPVGRGSQLVKDARRQGSPRLKSSSFSLQARNLKHQFQFEAEGRNPEQSRRGRTQIGVSLPCHAKS
jgi:hypothetical protein